MLILIPHRTTERTEYQQVSILSVSSESVRKKGTQNPRKPQKTLTSREIISVRSVKSVWDLKLRLPQVFEDERGLASGIVMLARIIARLRKVRVKI